MKKLPISKPNASSSEIFDIAKENRVDDMARLLLEYPQHKFLIDPDGFSALHYASIGNHTAIAECILQNGGDPNIVKKSSVYSKMRNLAECAKLENIIGPCSHAKPTRTVVVTMSVVLILLDHALSNGSLNLEDTNALFGKFRDRYLSDMQSLYDGMTQLGRCPPHVIENASLLLEAYPQVNSETATKEGQGIGMVFDWAKCVLKQTGGRGDTALHMATSKDMVKLLVGSGADKDMCNEVWLVYCVIVYMLIGWVQAGHTPLAVAIKNNRLEVAEALLLEAKCDPNKVAYRVRHTFICHCLAGIMDFVCSCRVPVAT
jgi:ankyrin repeat protein